MRSGAMGPPGFEPGTLLGVPPTSAPGWHPSKLDDGPYKFLSQNQILKAYSF